MYWAVGAKSESMILTDLHAAEKSSEGVPAAEAMVIVRFTIDEMRQDEVNTKMTLRSYAWAVSWGFLGTRCWVYYRLRLYARKHLLLFRASWELGVALTISLSLLLLVSDHFWRVGDLHCISHIAYHRNKQTNHLRIFVLHILWVSSLFIASRAYTYTYTYIYSHGNLCDIFASDSSHVDVVNVLEGLLDSCFCDHLFLIWSSALVSICVEFARIGFAWKASSCEAGGLVGSLFGNDRLVLVSHSMNWFKGCPGCPGCYLLVVWI